MRHRKLLMLILAAAAALGLPAEGFGQKSKDGAEDDYNLKKAWEVLQEDSNDTATALELLEKQLKATPDNVEALFLRARIYQCTEKYASALTDLNRAIKINVPKKTDIANSTLHAWKADVYSDSGDFKKAEEEQKLTVALARKDNRESLPGFLRTYAYFLSVNGKYDESDAVYNECIDEDEGDTPSMVGLARNQIARKNYDGALEILEKCRALSPDYAEVEHYEALAYDGKGETDKAIDCVIRLIDNNLKLVDDDMYDILRKHKTYAIAKMRIMAKEGENPEIFKAILPAVLQENGEYEEAIRLYGKCSAEIGLDCSDRIAECCLELGLYERALELADRVLERDPENTSALSAKLSALKSLGRLEEALIVTEKIIGTFPVSAWGYYAKGLCHEQMGDNEAALKSYDTGIDLDKDYCYIYLMRGKLRLAMGDKSGAEDDFRTVAKDTTENDISCRMYAAHYLGQDEEAERLMNKYVGDAAGTASENGVLYDCVCLLSLMGRPDEAVDALKAALKKGYSDFPHIETDSDLDSIREYGDFRALVSEYRRKLQERQERFLRQEETGKSEVGSGRGTTEVAINRKGGGTFEVPCSVNGLELKMIFDTGASDITISSVEANFMLKNGQLSRDDIKGRKYYQIANGDIAEGTTVTLREVKIGDAVLHNVDASVVNSQKAPILLGQSVLERFGTITIDNINSKLLIRQ